MTLVESITADKASYNAAIDATIAQINASRTATNTSLDLTISQLTNVAKDFPASIIAPPVVVDVPPAVVPVVGA